MLLKVKQKLLKWFLKYNKKRQNSKSTKKMSKQCSKFLMSMIKKKRKFHLPMIKDLKMKNLVKLSQRVTMKLSKIQAMRSHNLKPK